MSLGPLTRSIGLPAYAMLVDPGLVTASPRFQPTRRAQQALQLLRPAGVHDP